MPERSFLRLVLRAASWRISSFNCLSALSCLLNPSSFGGSSKDRTIEFPGYFWKQMVNIKDLFNVKFSKNLHIRNKFMIYIFLEIIMVCDIHDITPFYYGDSLSRSLLSLEIGGKLTWSADRKELRSGFSLVSRLARNNFPVCTSSAFEVSCARIQSKYRPRAWMRRVSN